MVIGQWPPTTSCPVRNLWSDYLVRLLSVEPLFLLWTPKRTIHLMWTLRRNLSDEMDSPCSIEGPNIIRNKILVALCWQGLLMYLIYQEEPQTELLASRTMPPCYSASPSESTTAEKPWFPLFNQWTETCPVQSEWHDLGASFTRTGPNWEPGQKLWTGPNWEPGQKLSL